MLNRREHWHWVTDDFKGPTSSRWAMKIQPEVLHWLKQRNILYKKNILRRRKSPGVQPATDLILHFMNVKDARYFTAVWGAKAIANEEIRELLRQGFKQGRS